MLLRSGQHSFALFGHPYEWESGAQCVKIKVGALMQSTGQTTTQLEPRLNFRELSDLRPVGTTDTTITYRDWPYHTYLCDEPITRLFDPRRVSTLGSVVFKPGAPGAADVPVGTRFPSSKGSWANPNDRANSIWNSTDEDVIDADERVHGRRRSPVPIQFHNGYPDFSEWQMASVQLSPLQTTNKDFQTYRRNNSPYGFDNYRSDTQFALDQQPPWLSSGGFADYFRVKTTTRQNSTMRYTWHHHEDGRTMLLIPSVINDIPHKGGADWTENARW